MTVRELQDRAAASAKAAREIKDKADAEGRGMSEEEAIAFDKNCKESRRLIGEAERQAEVEAIEAKLAKPVETKSKSEISDGARIEVTDAGPRMRSYGRLRSFKGPNALTQAYRAGRFLHAVLFDSAQSREWCRNHGIDIRRDMSIEARDAVEGVDTKGGFVVPDELEASIIDLREEYGNARQELRLKPMASETSSEPKKTGGLTAYPIGEGGSFTTSDQAWGRVNMVARKWGVLTKVSSELSEDTIVALAEDIAMDVAMAFAYAEDVACIDGDGSSAYHGIVGIRTKMIDGSHSGSYYDAISGADNWSEITDAILTSVMGKVKKYARRGAKWHCSPLAKCAVFDRLLRAAGGNTNQQIAQGQPAMYNGYPIVEWPAMPEDDAAAALNNKIMLIFGNLQQSSKFGTRRGITIRTLTERYADTDEIGIIATERFDIVHHSITGSSPTTTGPVCGLLGGT